MGQHEQSLCAWFGRILDLEIRMLVVVLKPGETTQAEPDAPDTNIPSFRHLCCNLEKEGQGPVFAVRAQQHMSQ